MNTTQNITIIPSQNQVIVDNIVKVIPDLSKDPRLENISAIQWLGNDAGHVELLVEPWYFEIGPKEFLSNVAPYLAMWEKQVIRDKEKRVKHENSIEFRTNKLLSIRKRELTATDYIVLPDYSIDENRKKRAIEYRQWLRDITKLPGFPWDGGEAATPWPECYPWAGK